MLVLKSPFQRKTSTYNLKIGLYGIIDIEEQSQFHPIISFIEKYERPPRIYRLRRGVRQDKLFDVL